MPFLPPNQQRKSAEGKQTTRLYGLFEWVRMPFGLKGASNSFIRALQQLLFPLRDFCDSYVGDIATFTSGRTEDSEEV